MTLTAHHQIQVLSSRSGAMVPVTRRSVKTHAKKLKDTGFVTEDNSGRGNIFPTASKAFYTSPTSAKAAQQGLGGAQGTVLVVAALVVVGVATAGVLSTGSGETLSQVQDAAKVTDSLSTIADRLAASL
ncbi:hypothetical protein V8C86DRAFT_2508808 [Haematococcus lacustris]